MQTRSPSTAPRCELMQKEIEAQKAEQQTAIREEGRVEMEKRAILRSCLMKLPRMI